ncbi:hypothetical protein MHL31_03095 [Lutibacter sp. A80]|uniref:hypothetical protein n=1 Tax=Lutibacter sp. A80 TaxID=2918453 RepID=UPI001F0709DF|nr:hypothetical protein [Lutibacter sp. A80]UMB61197.1 hypothetical protein MHL31_03095 [Lutibacter sp. A80]
MRKTFIFITLILTQFLNGQNNLVELKSYLSTIENVELISSIKTADFKTLSVLTTFDEIERKIDFGYEHHRILVMPNPGLDIKVNFISKNGKIIIGWVSEYDLSKDKHIDISTFKNNLEFLNNYIKNHNDFYKTQLNESDFKEQILTEYVVGFGCGEVGLDIPSESKKTLRLSKNKNKKALNRYLTSFSPELQTLGTIGLLKIGNLSDDQKQIIEHLKNINSVIFSCSGCLYGLGETFNERIANFE